MIFKFLKLFLFRFPFTFSEKVTLCYRFVSPPLYIKNTKIIKKKIKIKKNYVEKIAFKL